MSSWDGTGYGESVGEKNAGAILNVSDRRLGAQQVAGRLEVKMRGRQAGDVSKLPGTSPALGGFDCGKARNGHEVLRVCVCSCWWAGDGWACRGNRRRDSRGCKKVTHCRAQQDVVLEPLLRRTGSKAVRGTEEEREKERKHKREVSTESVQPGLSVVSELFGRTPLAPGEVRRQKGGQGVLGCFARSGGAWPGIRIW